MSDLKEVAILLTASPAAGQTCPRRELGGADPQRRVLCAAMNDRPPRSLATNSMRRLDGREAIFILITCGFALALYLFRAGSIPLTDPDEGRYAEISREMALSGDWRIPRLFGTPYLEKPPLLYWSTAIAFRSFGIHELSARLFPAAMAALGVLVVGLFAARRISVACGAVASVVLGLSGLYVVIARTVVADMPFTAALTTALLSFFFWREAPAERPAMAALFWIGLAAAVLSKGPAALVLGGAIVGIDALASRSWGWLRAPSLWTWSPLLVVITLPWFAMVQSRYPEYLSFYLWKEHLSRVAGSEHAAPFYWFVPWLIVGLLPWTPLAVEAAPRWWAQARSASRDAPLARFLLIWASVVFLLFSIAKGKLATYILPMFPPLALLLAMDLDDSLHDDVPRRGLARALLAVGVVEIGAAVTLVFVPSFGVAPVAVPPLLVGGVAILAWRKRRLRRSLLAIAASTAALYCGLAAIAPVVSDSFTARPLIAILSDRLGPNDHYALWGKYLPSGAFYLERPPLLVGLRPELRFGASLGEAAANVVADLPELGRRTRGGRLYVLTDNRKKRARELREALGEVDVVARNYAATLWLRR